MKDKVIAILENIIVDFDPNEEQLIDAGIMTSLNILQLIVELSNEFDVSIPPTFIKSENFNSVDAIISMVEKIRQEK